MDMATKVQILTGLFAYYVALIPLEKVCNPTILPPAMGNLGMATGL